MKYLAADNPANEEIADLPLISIADADSMRLIFPRTDPRDGVGGGDRPALSTALRLIRLQAKITGLHDVLPAAQSSSPARTGHLRFQIGWGTGSFALKKYFANISEYRL